MTKFISDFQFKSASIGLFALLLIKTWKFISSLLYFSPLFSFCSIALSLSARDAVWAKFIPEINREPFKLLWTGFQVNLMDTGHPKYAQAERMMRFSLPKQSVKMDITTAKVAFDNWWPGSTVNVGTQVVDTLNSTDVPFGGRSIHSIHSPSPKMTERLCLCRNNKIQPHCNWWMSVQSLSTASQLTLQPFAPYTFYTWFWRQRGPSSIGKGKN